VAADLHWKHQQQCFHFTWAPLAFHRAVEAGKQIDCFARVEPKVMGIRQHDRVPLSVFSICLSYFFYLSWFLFSRAVYSVTFFSFFIYSYSSGLNNFPLYSLLLPLSITPFISIHILLYSNYIISTITMKFYRNIKWIGRYITKRSAF
jgi:hypothetical protein